MEQSTIYFGYRALVVLARQISRYVVAQRERLQAR